MTAPRARVGYLAGVGSSSERSRLTTNTAVTSARPAKDEPLAVQDMSRIPPLPGRHVRRPRLTERLDDSPSRLILLLAPAGYGKTSLACEWLLGRRDASWYRCTSGSADVAAFSVGIAEAVRHLAPAAVDRLRQRLTVPEPPEAAARPLAEMLAEELTSWPQHAWLVIDDFHLVMESFPVGEFVDLLLEACPIRVVATSRRRPGWATARRRLHGEILELTTESLAMTSEEAEAVLDGRSSDAIETVVAQAEGWPAVIGLAAIADSDEIPRSEVAEQLYRYLAEEVLRLEPADIQAAVLRAAIPPTFDEGLCGSALEIPDPGHLLDHLRRAGIVIDVEDSRVAFHPLLRSFLLRRLESIDPDLARRLAGASLEHARRARRWARHTSSSCVAARPPTGPSSRPEPPTTSSRPARSRCSRNGSTSAVSRPSTMPLPASLVPRSCTGEVVSPKRRHLRETSRPAPRVSARSRLARGTWPGAPHTCGPAQRWHSSFTPGPGPPPRPSPIDPTRCAGVFLASIELEKGVDECLARLLEIEPDTDLLRARIATARTIRALANGHAREAHELMAPVAGLFPHISDPTVRSVVLLQFAYVQHARSEYSASLQLASDALQICRAYRLDFAQSICLYGCTLASIGRHDTAAARKTLQALRAGAASSPDPYLEGIHRCARVRLAIVEGDLDRALALASQPVLKETQPAIQAELLALGAVTAAGLGLHERARALADAAAETSCEASVHALVQLTSAIDLCMAGAIDQAKLRSLFRELADSELLDPMVVALRVSQPLLKALAQGTFLPLDLELLLERSGDLRLVETAGLQASDVPVESSRESRLTPREHEVLGLLCSGCSNAEIARRLVISPSTAKSHVRNILRKLGVNSRLQAAAYAAYRPESGRARQQEQPTPDAPGFRP